ncbi:MAG TPA: hypothetical protein VGH90_13050, partial [Chthoniobacteraceae bacterium]
MLISDAYGTKTKFPNRFDVFGTEKNRRPIKSGRRLASADEKQNFGGDYFAGAASAGAGAVAGGSAGAGAVGAAGLA